MRLTPLAAAWYDRALGLDETMSLTGNDTALGWEHALPAWVWAAIILLAFALAAASYARMLGPRWLRGVLAALRGLVLITLAVFLAGPTLVRTQVTPDPDWLLVMVDRSASMTFEDVEQDGGGVVSRDRALREALKAQAGLFSDDAIGEGRRIVWIGFDASAYEIDVPSGSAELESVLPDPAVRATNLRTAMDQALQLAAGRAVSGIVLMTDAQSPQPTGEAYARSLLQQEVPVFPVPLGSGKARLDLAVQRVEAPDSAFPGDAVPVAVTVSRRDIAAGVVDAASIDPADIAVRLVNADTGEAVDERTLEGTGFDAPLTMQAVHDTDGRLNLRVEVEYTGDAAALGALLEEISFNNNTRSLSVEPIERPIRVLYVEGTARWEYRFLTSMLKREESIDSSVLLLDADRDFVQEGDSRIRFFPATPEEVRPYDVIIIGDVRPRFFSETQHALIRDHVTVRGAGLLWIGGPRFTPAYYTGTDLELLLPMQQPGQVVRMASPGTNEVAILPSDDAHRLNLLRLARGEQEASGDAWPDHLPPFYWAQDLGPLRPGAVALAQAAGTVEASTGEPKASVVLYRYGAGEVIYVGTDEIWRWRKAGGEVYYEQFWIQLIRKLGRSRVAGRDDRAALTVDPPVVDLGAPQVVELVIDDPALIRMAPALIRAEVRTLDPGTPETPLDDASSDNVIVIDEVLLRPVGEAVSAPGAAERLTYRAVWRGDRPGGYTLHPAEPLLEPIGLSANAEVNDPAQELARAATDHPRLVRLAQATGGQVVALNELSKLKDLVPDRAREITSQTRRPLTNTMAAIAVILLLLTLEWSLRRVARLV